MKNRSIIFQLSFVFLLCGIAKGNSVHERLYINRGIFTTVKGTTFPSLAYNTTPVFNARNAVINLTTGDTLFIIIINKDNVPHSFTVKNITTFSPILPGDSITRSYVFQSEGVFVYYDSVQYPSNRYMGLAGMICVSQQSSAKPFYWNIKEHQTGFNNTLAAGGTVDWNSYDPDYFTINGLSHPDLQNDPTARVNGNVGDTMHIYVANTGQSTHSIHFHGFHCRVVYSTTPSIQVGSSKDTFPFGSMQGALLEMVPDKAGKYSVHDHNLVAVSGGGTHPNGMFIIMSFQ